MNAHITTLRNVREFVLSITDGLTPEQLNEIPTGFPNNIIWNLAHLVAAQQGVCYKRAGLPVYVDDNFFDAYKPGSFPSGDVDEDEIARIRSLAVTTLDLLEADYNAGRFANYTHWATRYGVAMNSIEDALHFLSFHEGLHAGYIMALKRVVMQ